MGDDPRYALKWAPGDGLTWDEWHAMELGLVGLLAGAAARAGFVEQAVGFSFLLVSVAWGLKKAPEEYPVAAHVTRREPWYFTTVYVLAAAAAYIALEYVPPGIPV